LKPSLYRVELRRVGWKAQELHVLGAHYLFRAMAWGTIEYEEKMVLGVGFREPFEERLQASAVHPRKIKTEAFSRCGFDCRVEVGPLVGAADDIGWAKALRAVSPLVPVDEAKTCFIKGQDLQWLVVGLWAAELPYPTGKLF
jgi:hypothetical protein